MSTDAKLQRAIDVLDALSQTAERLDNARGQEMVRLTLCVSEGVAKALRDATEGLRSLRTSIRPDDELQRAHDLLVGILLGEAPQPSPSLLRSDMKLAREHAEYGDRHGANRELLVAELRTAADALCWAMGHDHNVRFAERLAAIEADLADSGFVLGKGPPG